jgi:prepilin peptidase CpaA
LSYLPPVFQFLVALIVVAAAYFDLRYRRVPNWLTLTGVLSGIALNTFLLQTQGLLFSLKGLGGAMLIYFPLYMLRAMGAGDVKLMAAVGAIVGLWNCVAIIVVTLVLGGIAAFVLVVAKRRLRRTFQNMGIILVSLAHREAPYRANPELDVASEQAIRLPHAVVIAVGALCFLAAADIWAPR